jgi:hypothetical protein
MACSKQVATLTSMKHTKLFVKAIMKVLKLAPSSFTYVMTLSNGPKQVQIQLFNHGNFWNLVNLIDIEYNMLWFPLFISVINHQGKSVQPTLWDLKVKCKSDHCGFNEGRENMLFHGLIDHVKDNYLIRKILSIWKHNLTTLLKD